MIHQETILFYFQETIGELEAIAVPDSASNFKLCGKSYRTHQFIISFYTFFSLIIVKADVPHIPVVSGTYLEVKITFANKVKFEVLGICNVRQFVHQWPAKRIARSTIMESYFVSNNSYTVLMLKLLFVYLYVITSVLLRANDVLCHTFVCGCDSVWHFQSPFKVIIEDFYILYICCILRDLFY